LACVAALIWLLRQAGPRWALARPGMPAVRLMTKVLTAGDFRF
jgi:hypothetical protein